MIVTDNTLESLVRMAADGNAPLAERHRAFGQLVARFQDLAFGCAFALSGDRSLAEEAAQEAFIAAWRNLGQLREAHAFPGWLKRIVVTRCQRLRARGSAGAVTVPLDTAVSVAAPKKDTPAERLLKAERVAQVHTAVAALPERERLAVTLFYIGDHSRQEVADFLGISPVAVKKRLAAARSRLKERLLIAMQEDLVELRPSNSDDFAARILGFTRLFSGLVDSGVPLIATLNRLAAQETDADFRAALAQIGADLYSGSCLSQAMRQHPRYFNERYLAVIREGEISGMLDVSLSRLASGDT